MKRIYDLLQSNFGDVSAWKENAQAWRLLAEWAIADSAETKLERLDELYYLQIRKDRNDKGELILFARFKEKKEKSESTHGIDHRNKKLYPIADWNQNDIMKWLNRNKLPLTIEYSYDLHDINMPFNFVLEWLKINYPDDYKLAVSQFPFLEEDLLKWQMR